METLKRDLRLPVTCVDAIKQFLRKIKGVVGSEMKNKIIGKEFIFILDAFFHIWCICPTAQELKDKLGNKPAYLVQGTLHPDVIESCPPPWNWKNTLPYDQDSP